MCTCIMVRRLQRLLHIIGVTLGSKDNVNYTWILTQNSSCILTEVLPILYDDCQYDS